MEQYLEPVADFLGANPELLESLLQVFLVLSGLFFTWLKARSNWATRKFLTIVEKQVNQTAINGADSLKSAHDGTMPEAYGKTYREVTVRHVEADLEEAPKVVKNIALKKNLGYEVDKVVDKRNKRIRKSATTKGRRL